MYYSLNFIICIFISQHRINVFYYWPLRVSVQLSADIWTCLTGSSTAASKNQKTKPQFYLENEPKICRFIWFDCSVLLPPWQQKNTVLSFLLKNLAGTLSVNMKRETKDILCRHGDSDTLLRFTFCQLNKPKSVSSAVRFSFWAERLHILQHVSGLTSPSLSLCLVPSLSPGGAERSWGPGGPLCLRCPAEETSCRWTRGIRWSCRSLSPTSRYKRTPDPRPRPGTRPPDAASEDS